MKEKTYSYEEAYEASLQYFKGDELAARVWVNKYSMKDSYGHIYEVSPEDMHHRIANEIARIENKYENPLRAEEIFDLLDHFKYIIPAGSPMTGIGTAIRQPRFPTVLSSDWTARPTLTAVSYASTRNRCS